MPHTPVLLIALTAAAYLPAGCCGRQNDTPDPMNRPENWIRLIEAEDPRPYALLRAVAQAVAEKSERQLAAATGKDTEFVEYHSPGEGGPPYSMPTTCAGLAGRGLNGCSAKACQYSVSKLLHTSTAAAGRAGGRDVVARGLAVFRDQEAKGRILELEVRLVGKADGAMHISRVELRHIDTVNR